MRHELAPRNIYNLLLGASLTWGYFWFDQRYLAAGKIKIYSLFLILLSLCHIVLDLQWGAENFSAWPRKNSKSNSDGKWAQPRTFLVAAVDPIALWNFLIAFINFSQVFFHLILVAFMTVKVILHTRLIKQAAGMKNQKVTSNFSFWFMQLKEEWNGKWSEHCDKKQK